MKVHLPTHSASNPSLEVLEQQRLFDQEARALAQAKDAKGFENLNVELQHKVILILFGWEEH